MHPKVMGGVLEFETSDSSIEQQPMGLHTASRLDRLAIGGEAKALKAGQLNIGPRLMLGLAVIIFSMLAADALCFGNSTSCVLRRSACTASIRS